jgi:5-methylcytosine-specific restriction protein A
MVEYLAPTKRRKMTKARAAKIFLREQGRCYKCRRRLRVGVDKYQIEHPDPLCLGGSDDDADLRVICDDCHKPKTAQDAAAKAKRDRIITSSFDDGRGTPKMKGRGFRKVKPQRKATAPVVGKFPGDIMARQRRDG